MSFNLKTGDILLFDYKAGGAFGIFTKLIKYFTKSDYSHVAMVIKDPAFIHPSLKGTYIWESSWEGKPDPQDGEIKLGVQITPFLEIYDHYKYKNSKIYLRSVTCDPNLFNTEKLKEIHKVVYDKPYDIVPKDWIGAIERKDPEPQKTTRFLPWPWEGPGVPWQAPWHFFSNLFDFSDVVSWFSFILSPTNNKCHGIFEEPARSGTPELVKSRFNMNIVLKSHKNHLKIK